MDNFQDYDDGYHIDEADQVHNIFEEMLLQDHYIRDLASSSSLELIEKSENRDGKTTTSVVPDIVGEFSARLEAFRLKEGIDSKEFIITLEDCIYQSKNQSTNFLLSSKIYSLAKHGCSLAKHIFFPLKDYFLRKEKENARISSENKTLSKIFRIEIDAFNETIRELKEGIESID